MARINNNNLKDMESDFFFDDIEMQRLTIAKKVTKKGRGTLGQKTEEDEHIMVSTTGICYNTDGCETGHQRPLWQGDHKQNVLSVFLLPSKMDFVWFHPFIVYQFDHEQQDRKSLNWRMGFDILIGKNILKPTLSTQFLALQPLSTRPTIH
nr:unnamed protein product [Callosobruchus analis]